MRFVSVWQRGRGSGGPSVRHVPARDDGVCGGRRRPTARPRGRPYLLRKRITCTDDNRSRGFIVMIAYRCLHCNNECLNGEIGKIPFYHHKIILTHYKRRNSVKPVKYIWILGQRLCTVNMMMKVGLCFLFELFRKKIVIPMCFSIKIKLRDFNNIAPYTHAYLQGSWSEFRERAPADLQVRPVPKKS